VEIKPPTADDLAVLLAKNAHRFPDKRTISLPGDRGSTVRIPVLIGNPSGACKMPIGERPSAAWSNVIAETFSVLDKGVDVVRQAAADCVLWPDPLTWAQVAERWPAAPDTLWKAAREKCGASLAQLDIPAADEQPHELVKAVLDKYPRAVWRRLDGDGTPLVIVVDAPKSIAWSFFSSAMRKSDSDRWELITQMTQGAVPGAWRVTPATMSTPEQLEPFDFIGEGLARWPGFALHVALTLGQLAGIAARVDRDGW